jgi:hypothetical protein
MTKRGRPKDSLEQLDQAMLDETDREEESFYGRAIEEIAKKSGILWPKLEPNQIGSLALQQAALQQHLANGGDPEENPSPFVIRRAMEALEVTSAHIKYQSIGAMLDACWEKDVEMLLPLLTAKEQTERRITFARAVMITTGNHDRKNERPSRWIPIFRAKAAERMETSLKWLVGSIATDTIKKIKSFDVYAKYGPDGLLPLNEFAEMFCVLAYDFPRGRELAERLGGSHLDHTLPGQAKALKKIKKVLAPVSGQPKKSTPRKPKKRRTKTA